MRGTRKAELYPTNFPFQPFKSSKVKSFVSLFKEEVFFLQQNTMFFSTRVRSFSDYREGWLLYRGCEVTGGPLTGDKKHLIYYLLQKFPDLSETLQHTRQFQAIKGWVVFRFFLIFHH